MGANGSTWIEHFGEIETPDDGPPLARGLVNPAGPGLDFGELPRLLPAQFRFPLPAGPRGDVHRHLSPGVLRPHLFRPGRAVHRTDPGERIRPPPLRWSAPGFGPGSSRRVAATHAPQQRGDGPTYLRRLAGGPELSPAVGDDSDLCDRRRRPRPPPTLRTAPPVDAPVLCLDLFGGDPPPDLGDGGAGRGAEPRGGLRRRGVEQLARPVGGLRDRRAVARNPAGVVVTVTQLKRPAARTAGALLSGRVRRRVALQRPHGALEFRGNAFAFLVDRHALRGESLPVFQQALELHHHFFDLGERDPGLDVGLEKLRQLLPL